MKTAKITATVIAISLLAACTQPNGQPNRGVMNGGGINKQDVGTVGGGVLGAVVGSSFGKGNGRVVGGVLGAGLGALLGNQIGASLDNADRAAASQTAYNTFETNPTGRPGTWRNPDSGNYGTYTPTKTYQAPGGEYCREFTQTIVVGGKKQEGYGTACRQPDGTWAIQN